MCPDAFFHIGKEGYVYPYGLMIGVGILACFIVLYWYGRLLKVHARLLDFCFYTGIASIAIGFACANLWQSVYDFIEDPSGGFHISKGITVIGGLLGGAAFFAIIYFAIYRRLSKERIIHALPIIPCCILIAHAFGRIGCFFAGCCHGRVTESFLGVQFPGDNYKVLPTQLWEAFFLFLMFGICTYLLLQHRYRLTFPLYTLSYGIFRFVIEFFRGDHRGSFIPGISPSQFWCILIVIGSIPFFILLARAYKKLDAESGDDALPAAEEAAQLAPADVPTALLSGDASDTIVLPAEYVEIVTDEENEDSTPID